MIQDVKTSRFRTSISCLLVAMPLTFYSVHAAPVSPSTTLRVYEINGVGTTDTRTNTENPGHLTTTAKVKGAFALKWSRKRPSALPLKGTLVFFLWDAAKQEVIVTKQKLPRPSVAIPSGATSINVTYTIPANAVAGLYRAIVVSAQSNNDLGFTNYPPISNSVLLTYK
jgi:hypothetical protein